MGWASMLLQAQEPAMSSPSSPQPPKPVPRPAPGSAPTVWIAGLAGVVVILLLFLLVTI